MTEHRKLPEPPKTLLERAESMFGLGGFTPAAVPKELKKPVNRRPQPGHAEDRQPPSHQTQPRRPPCLRPQCRPSPQRRRLPNRRPVYEDVEFSDIVHMIDRDCLARHGLIQPEGQVTELLEEFRIVKRQVLQAVRKARETGSGALAQRVLVCSPHPDEGKSYCAANLAIALAAEKDSEVLLVDADFAKPSLLKMLGLPKGPGFMDILAREDMKVEDCVLATDIAGLHVLPAGNHTTSDSEYLASHRTAEVLDRLTRAAPNRIVIFDSPPALAASQAAELAEHVGQAIVVARADRTGPERAGRRADAAVVLSRSQAASQRRAFQPQRASLRRLLRRGSLIAMRKPTSLLIGTCAGFCRRIAACSGAGSQRARTRECRNRPIPASVPNGLRAPISLPISRLRRSITAQLQPGDDVLTYTQLAVGVDATVAGRNSSASASLRYEREIGYGDAVDGDTISGIARASVGLLRRGITLEAGGLASRTRLESGGFSSIGAVGGNDDASSQIYSVYAGPTVQTRSGPLEISGAYRLGYTRVDSSDVLITAPGEAASRYLR